RREVVSLLVGRRNRGQLVGQFGLLGVGHRETSVVAVQFGASHCAAAVGCTGIAERQFAAALLPNRRWSGARLPGGRRPTVDAGRVTAPGALDESGRRHTPLV